MVTGCFFLVQGGLLWFFMVPGWFCIVPGGLSWFFMVPGCMCNNGCEAPYVLVKIWYFSKIQQKNYTKKRVTCNNCEFAIKVQKYIKWHKNYISCCFSEITPQGRIFATSRRLHHRRQKFSVWVVLFRSTYVVCVKNNFFPISLMTFGRTGSDTNSVPLLEKNLLNLLSWSQIPPLTCVKHLLHKSHWRHSTKPDCWGISTNLIQLLNFIKLSQNV